jgi:hypothetical protein
MDFDHKMRFSANQKEIIRMTAADVILNAAAKKAEKGMLRLENF